MLSESKVGIIIEAQDRASAQLKKVERSLVSIQKRMVNMRPTFQRMAVIGTAAFATLAVGVGLAVKQAGLAEGAYNKFNSVFKESSEDMLRFVDDLRQVMPTATSQIVRMAADLQDLLVPMGLSRELAQDMTKGFLTLSNQLAAFNDVDPTQVIEAMKSALVGSSEPLRRFGIDARVTTLETTALAEGLLKAGQKFADLTPEVRSQVTAQALLIQAVKQSSDAIEGFAVNQDSFLRRFQEMEATLIEVKEEIGIAFLPILDDLLKALLPIIRSVADWIKKNPELTKIIIIGAAALAGLVGVLGTIGLIFLSVASAVSALGITMAGVFSVIGVGLVIAGIVWIANSLKGIYEVLFDVELAWKDVWNAIIDFTSDKMLFLVDKMKPILDVLSKIKSFTGGFISNIKGSPAELAGSVLDLIDNNSPISSQGAGGVSYNFDLRGATVTDANSFVREVSKGLSRSLNLAEQGI